jgi:hypothetical protein
MYVGNFFSFRINRISHISDNISDIMSWSLSEATVPDSKNWRQLSLDNDIIELNPGNYSILLTLDSSPQFAQIDFLIGTDNPTQKYYRFTPGIYPSFKSEPMLFTAPTKLKLYIYYKVVKVPHIQPEHIEPEQDQTKKIPHIASELITGNLFINT